MADDQDFDILQQVRTKYPQYQGVDDQTLAGALDEKYPQYRPYLSKYTPDTSSNLLAKQSALPDSGTAAADLNKTIPRTTLSQALTSPSPTLVRAASGIGNPYIRGAAQKGAEMMTPANAMTIAAAGTLPPGSPAAGAAAGSFGVQGAISFYKQIPELWRDLKAGLSGDDQAMDTFKAGATRAGLTAGFSALGLAGAGGAMAGEAAPPKMVPDEAATAAAKTVGKAAEAVKDIPGASEAAEAQKAAQEAAAEQSQVPDQMRPEEPEETEGPPIVKGTKPVQTSSGPVQPNPPAIDEVRDELRDTLKAKGVDPDDPQAQANLYAKWYGLSKPINIASVGDVPVSESSDAGTHYDFDLAKNDPTMVAHELQHARQNEGQIPEVPEGPGANDAISGRVTQDLGGMTVPREINIEHLQTPEAVKAEIQQRVQELPPRSVVPREQTIAAASNLGFSIEDSQRLADETGDLPQRLLAANQIVIGATEKYHLARDAWLADRTNLGAKQAAEMAENTILQTMEPFTRAGTNVARSLNVLGAERGGQWPAIPSDIADALTVLGKKGQLSQAIRDKLLETDLGDPAQRQNLRKALEIPPMPGEGLAARISNRISQYYTNSILSGVPTAMRKLGTDVGTLLTAPLETLAAGEPRAAAARLLGNFSGLDDAWLTYVRALKNGSEFYQPTDAFGGMTGKIINTPTRNLGALTDFVRQLHVGGTIAENAIMDGATLEEAREAQANPTQAQLDRALPEASDRVYASKPGAFGSAASAMRSSTPFGKIIAPVIQFGIKMAKQGVDMSPVGMAKVAYDALNGKEITNMQLGRGVLGSALWAWTAHMVNAGKMTGEGPLDPVEFRRKEDTGWRPNSFVVTMPDFLGGGIKYIPFGWFGGPGFSMSMAATLAESIREAPNAVDKGAAATMMGGHFGRFMLNQPYMQGISSMIDAFHDPRLSEKFLGGILGGFLSPSLVAGAARAQDKYDRELSTWVDMVRSRVPFFRESIPPKRDLEGDPIQAAGSPESRFAGAFSASEAKPLGLAQRVAQDAKIGRSPGSVPFYGANLNLDQYDRDERDQIAGQNIKAQFARINAAPSNFPTDPGQQKEEIRKIVSDMRSAADLQMIKNLNQRGTLQAYADAAAGRKSAKSAPNPYNDVIDQAGIAKANDTMERYRVTRTGLPSGVPEDLAPEYSRELDRALGMYLYPAYADPAKFHAQNPSFESAKGVVQNLYDIAQKHAIQQTLNPPNSVKSQPEAGQ